MNPQHDLFFIARRATGDGVQFSTYSNIDPIPAATDIVSHIFIADMDKSGNNVMADSPLMPRLGDILPLYGVPTCMFVRDPDFWELHYNLGDDGLSVIEVYVKGLRLWPGQPVYLPVLLSYYG